MNIFNNLAAYHASSANIELFYKKDVPKCKNIITNITDF